MTGRYPGGNDIAVGDTGPEVLVEEVTQRDLVKYAGASGDFNPIHYHEETAKRAGHPGVIAQGMFIAGLMDTMVVDWLGINAIQQFGVRFNDIVRPGEKVSITGTVVEKSESNDGAKIEVQVTATTNESKNVATGHVTATLPVDGSK